MTVLPTPFHVRMAEHNRRNLWCARGGFTVPAAFGSVTQEALAARVSAVLADMSGFTRLRIRGAGAARLLSAACACDVAAVQRGSARPVFWTADAGGVRGTGVVGRFGETEFLLSGMQSDASWFAAAAPRFGAAVHDITATTGVLFLSGPSAAAVLAAAGLGHGAQLPHLQQRVYAWRSLTVTVSRWFADGFEITCAAEDAVIVFDRLYAAGRDFGLTPAGQHAFELLFLENGIVIPGLDFEPARRADAEDPKPGTLGLPDASDTARVLAGVEFDSEDAIAPTPLYRSIGASTAYTGEFLFRPENKAGDILRAAWSPVLKRTIAFATLARMHAVPGTELLVRTAAMDGLRQTRARAVTLPFVK